MRNSLSGCASLHQSPDYWLIFHNSNHHLLIEWYIRVLIIFSDNKTANLVAFQDVKICSLDECIFDKLNRPWADLFCTHYGSPISLA